MPKYHVSSALPRLARPRGPRLGPLSAVVCQRSRHSQGNRTPIVKARSKLQYIGTVSGEGGSGKRARAVDPVRRRADAPRAHTATVYQLPASLNTQVKKKQSKKPNTSRIWFLCGRTRSFSSFQNTTAIGVSSRVSSSVGPQSSAQAHRPSAPTALDNTTPVRTAPPTAYRSSTVRGSRRASLM